MKFNEYVYLRPDFDTIKAGALELIEKFSKANDVEEQLGLIKQFNADRFNVMTANVLCSIRHSINTKDEFYESENNYWDQQGPLYEELTVNFYKALLESPFIEQLQAKMPQAFFKIVEFSLKSFDPKIIEDLQEENRLSSEYQKLIASAQIEFDGKVYTLPQLTPLTQSTDRSIRKRATDARLGFFEQNESKLDEIYHDLVQLRDKIAKKLGYKNFIELGYIRMMRLDYDAAMVDVFRKQVLSDIVPVSKKLFKRQQERLGLDKLLHYDLGFEFTSGNAKPIGDPDFIVENGRKMYHELSKETAEFIDFMLDRELVDLVSKPGKAGGGYCTYIADYQSPFIFSNFNGTSGDIDVLTHEAGHAFQVFSSRHIEVPECMWPTMESAEIHSMSMEFFTWPWMENFFGEQAQKYRYTHLGGAIKFIPYGVLVDHFQHEVYANPDMSPDQRKSAWRKLQRQYLPHIDYAESEFLEKGTFWFQQAHIFQMPFYYIDYTLAQICALQFFKRIQDKDENAWKDYHHLCTLGGTMSFTGLVKEANLKSPFEEGCVSSVITTIDQWLEGVDDKVL